MSARNDGTLEALYITLLDSKCAHTVEVIEDILLADYDKQDRLVGIEVLAPVKLSAIANLVEVELRAPFRKFVKQQAPEELVLA